MVNKMPPFSSFFLFSLAFSFIKDSSFIIFSFQLSFIKGHVTEPLSQLVQLFQAPFRLIQKRHDKCLDYDRAKNKCQRAKDSKERDKIYQVWVSLNNTNSKI